MAFRLSDFVIAGEIYNYRLNSVFGSLQLRGCDTPVSLHLTGNLSEDLRGKNFEFAVPANDRPPTDEDRQSLRYFINQQVGPAGEMTAARKVRATGCPPIEFYLRCKMGEPPPVAWQQCLFLEWFSQNGRVVIELPAPQMRFLNDPETPDYLGDADFQSEEELALDQNEEGFYDAPFAESLDCELEPFGPRFAGDDETDAESEPEGYGLVPEELNRELERNAYKIDLEIAGESEDAVAQEIAECELMDDLIENGVESPLRELIEDLALPEPSEELNEDEAEKALKKALVRLAAYGLAFDVCEHCSPREAYRILIEKVCVEGGYFPEMRGTSWVTHYSTSDDCPACEKEFGEL